MDIVHRIGFTRSTPLGRQVAGGVLSALALSAAVGVARADSPLPLVQYGTMRQALAEGESQARARLADLMERPHFFAVGALTDLNGEVTILDSAPFATTIGPDGALEHLDAAGQAVTLLVGQSVPSWTGVRLDEDTAPDRFDAAIRDAAVGQGVDVSTPFMFVIEGELTDVRLHVIHGACPLHARMNAIELPEDQRPYEATRAHISGTVVGLYAADAVGKLTHPGTDTHAHIIYVDDESGQRVTAHVERAGIAKGAIVRVPDAAGADDEVGGREDGR